MKVNERDSALQQYLSSPTVQNRNALISHHHGLIQSIIIHQMHVPLRLRTDAFNEGIIGICRAIETYKPESGPFAPWAAIKIRAAVQAWMESEIRQQNQRVIGAKARLRVNRGQTLTSNRGGNLDMIEAEGFDSFTMCVGKLDGARVRAIATSVSMDERELAIITEHICEDRSLSDVAARFGLSKQRMGQIKNDLMERIRAAVGGVV
jgi:RNA polymerase sigma factor (sigma-70 family)